MSVNIRSGVSDGAIQYNAVDKITVNTGNVSVTANLSVSGSGAFTSNLTLGGNQVLTTLNGGLGYNQTWQNVTGSRSSGVSYTNLTGKPIYVSVRWPSAASGNNGGTITVDGIIVASWNSNSSSPSLGGSVMAIIPPNSVYVVTNAGIAFTLWAELR